MLKELYIHNYRRFSNTTLKFDSTILLAGKHGTGKTTVVELINKIKQFILNKESIEVFSPINNLSRWLKNDFGESEIEFALKYTADDKNIEYKYSLKLQINLKENKYRICDEKLHCGGVLLYDFHIDQDERGIANVIADDKREFPYMIDWERSGLTLASRINSDIRYFMSEIKNKLHVFILSLNGHQGNKESSELDIYGGNFSQWFADMLTQKVIDIPTVLNSYSEFLSNFKEVYINRDTAEFTIKEGCESSNLFDIKFSELSTGQKKLIIYYAVFKFMPKGSCLIFDEFDNHLSPAELQPLYDLAQERQDDNDLQLIIVSHHHKTLNWYNKEAYIFYLDGMPAHIKIDDKPEDRERKLVSLIEGF
ncbi:MAG: ATP-binding protein [Elusimicrobiota bacterium]|nr:ATP-binding protein [Elusimicrobiota bacterium]